MENGDQGMTAVQTKKSGTFPERSRRVKSAGGMLIGADEDRGIRRDRSQEKKGKTSPSHLARAVGLAAGAG